MDTAPIRVEHEVGRCFHATVDGLRCEADYRLADGAMHMTHTDVPPPLQGRGIAARLVRAALEHAQREGLQVAPHCPYVAAYLQRHPELEPLRARDA